MGKLFLPHLYPLGIGKLGMIDAQPAAKDPLQTLGYLGSQSNFRQQIKYLLALTDRLINEVNIDFGLAAGSDSVEQTDILHAERSTDFVEGPLLVDVQFIE